MVSGHDTRSVWQLDRRSHLQLTLRWQYIVIGAQAQEEEERHEPDADGKERCNVHEAGSVDGARLCSISVSRLSLGLGLLCLFRKIEEPEKVIRDDHDAGQEEPG